MSDFKEVIYHRLKYFFSPQLDLYRNIRADLIRNHDHTLNHVAHVLDYGCGNGVGTMLLLMPSYWEVYGVDVDSDATQFGIEVFGHLVCFDDHDWSGEEEFDDRAVGKYDSIVCVETIEHIEDVDARHRLLTRFHEHLRPGGRLYISTLNHNSQYRKNGGHVKKFKVNDFKELMRGFFPFCVVTDYKLRKPLEDDSSITPMVMLWRKPDG